MKPLTPAQRKVVYAMKNGSSLLFSFGVYSTTNLYGGRNERVSKPTVHSLIERGIITDKLTLNDKYK